MSIKAFKRVFWIVLDCMGYEHARRCVDTGRFPSFSRLSRDGSLGPSEPSTPGCQTPSALYTLFSGAEPARSGIWGYRMPDPDRREKSMSGFHARLHAPLPVWHSLSEKGRGFSVMNVAFRNDPVWSGRVAGTDFAFDGYRMWRRPGIHRLDGALTAIEHQGLEVHVRQSREGIQIRKGRSVTAALRVGEAKRLSFSAGASAYAFLFRRELLLLSPLSQPLVRGTTVLPGAGDPFLDVNAFRISRGSAEIPVATEMLPSRHAMEQKVRLMLETIRGTSSALVVGYFPVIDELNHVYAHQLESSWPQGRVSELFAACAELVDDCIARVMHEADEDTAVMVSSDHGVVPQRAELHLNEILAAEGVVKRAREGYDFSRSEAYYHPSDCGLVLGRSGARGGNALLPRVQGALARARERLGVDIGVLTEGLPSPGIAFLFPRDDTGLTGRPPRRGRDVLDRESQGGHHLSPLTPTPWIKAMLGAWSPRQGFSFRDSIPKSNSEVSGWLQGLLEGKG